MPKRKITFKLTFWITALLTGSLIPVTSLPVYSQPCDSGIPSSTNYIFRGDRCEGIQRGQVDQTRSGAFRLVSLATGKINSYSRELTLKIPANIPKKPEVRVQSLQKDYLMDNASLQTNSPPYIFTWPSDILQQEGVSSHSLRAIAWTTLNSQNVLYLPVILGLQPSQYYEIAWYSRYRAKINRFDIIQSSNNKVVKNCPRPTLSPNQEVFCQWDGRNHQEGDYQIYVKGELYPSNRPPRPLERRITFEHNPKWLRK